MSAVENSTTKQWIWRKTSKVCKASLSLVVALFHIYVGRNWPFAIHLFMYPFILLRCWSVFNRTPKTWTRKCAEKFRQMSERQKKKNSRAKWGNDKLKHTIYLSCVSLRWCNDEGRLFIVRPKQQYRSTKVLRTHNRGEIQPTLFGASCLLYVYVHSSDNIKIFSITIVFYVMVF